MCWPGGNDTTDQTNGMRGGLDVDPALLSRALWDGDQPIPRFILEFSQYNRLRCSGSIDLEW